MTKKTLDFSDETKYFKLAGAAKSQNRTIGNFILELYDFWVQKNGDKQ